MFWRRKKSLTDTSPRDWFLEVAAPIWDAQDSEFVLIEDGFEWLPGSHTVRVHVHPDARKLHDAPGLRIAINTDYRRSVPVDSEQFVRLTGVSAALCCPTYSWVYPPAEVAKEFYGSHPTDMHLFASAYIDEHTKEWLPAFLARMSIMQPINAEIHSDMPSDIFCGAQPHFAGGSKAKTINGVLNAVRDVFVPAGKSPSKWAGSDEFEAFVNTYGRSELCVGYCTPDGMALETPFGSDSAFIFFKTDENHHQLGHGLLVATLIGAGQIDHRSFSEAAGLNFLESRLWTDIPQSGCWHPQGEAEDLAHSFFVPNSLFMPNLVGYLAHWALERVQWMRSKRLPDMPDLTMSEILEDRLKRH